MSRLRHTMLGVALAASLGASYPPAERIDGKRPAPPVKRKLTKAEKKALKRSKPRPPQS